MKHAKAVIIGSGVAGMSAAIRLAVQGFDVSVYEANSTAGGKISAFKKEGYHFDAGPSLFTQPQLIEELFALANEPIEAYFTFEKLESSCKYFFENNKQIVAYADVDALENELAEKTGEAKGAVKKYLTASKKLYHNIGEVFLNHSLHKRSTWFHSRALKALATVKFSYLFKSLHKYNHKKFSTPEVAQIFNRYATYNGSSPFKAPAMLSLIPHVELNEGAFYPYGGMINIANALYKLAQKKGVKFYFETPVQRIIYHDAIAKGIVVANQNIFSDIVISNADVYFTYKHLLSHQPRATKIDKLQRSSSAIIFYWGVKQTFAELQLHNIFFSSNYRQEFDDIFRKKKLSNDITVYVNITAKMEQAHARPGCENWFVMVNAPANAGQSWNEIVTQAKAQVIEKLNRALQTDIEPLIETEEVLNPILIEEKTGSYKGALYGSSSNATMAAFFRPPNFSSVIKNLYFCGGSVHPGGGIPLCFKSAKIVTDLIVKDIKKQKH